jgi:hypothetical protein
VHDELGLSTGECLLYVLPVGVVVGGFLGATVIGGVARALLPGPDPMSAVTQAAIGAISLASALAVWCLADWPEAVPAGLLVAVVLVAVHRPLRRRWLPARGRLWDGLREWGRSLRRGS